MRCRLRVPPGGGREGHGDTPSATRAPLLAVRLRKFSPGERDLGVFAPKTRYNTPPWSGTISESASAPYQLIAGFPNRRRGFTVSVMHARSP